ncbi:MAG TPA: glycosyltransferase, partial [Methanosarcinales archaeon]|nr:glycosyltransferase [Methanosarcinales archaeon]
DNMPNVVLEAMSHGEPVVATRLGSLLELISEGINGFFLPRASLILWWFDTTYPLFWR